MNSNKDVLCWLANEVRILRKLIKNLEHRSRDHVENQNRIHTWNVHAAPFFPMASLGLLDLPCRGDPCYIPSGCCEVYLASLRFSPDPIDCEVGWVEDALHFGREVGLAGYVLHLDSVRCGSNEFADDTISYKGNNDSKDQEDDEEEEDDNAKSAEKGNITADSISYSGSHDSKYLKEEEGKEEEENNQAPREKLCSDEMDSSNYNTSHDSKHAETDDDSYEDDDPNDLCFDAAVSVCREEYITSESFAGPRSAAPRDVDRLRCFLLENVPTAIHPDLDGEVIFSSSMGDYLELRRENKLDLSKPWSEVSGNVLLTLGVIERSWRQLVGTNSGRGKHRELDTAFYKTLNFKLALLGFRGLTST